jgi:hypothetical protein
MDKIIKHISFLLLPLSFLVATFVFFGCKKPEEQVDVYKGTANALRNGEFWDAECTALYSLQNENEVSISIDRYNTIGEKREHLSIVRIPLVTGLYTVVKLETDSVNNILTQYSASYFSVTADGDAVDGIYHVLESDSNCIEITKIDLNTKNFVGKFSITYVRDTTFNMNSNLPDTLWFTEGEFQTKIQESW